MTIATPVHLPRILSTSVTGGCDQTARLVVIPTRDHAERIVTCLAALWDKDVDALVVTNSRNGAARHEPGTSRHPLRGPRRRAWARRLGVAQRLAHSGTPRSS